MWLVPRTRLARVGVGKRTVSIGFLSPFATASSARTQRKHVTITDSTNINLRGTRENISIVWEWAAFCVLFLKCRNEFNRREFLWLTCFLYYLKANNLIQKVNARSMRSFFVTECRITFVRLYICTFDYFDKVVTKYFHIDSKTELLKKHWSCHSVFTKFKARGSK